MKTATPQLTNSINRSPLRRVFLLTPLVLVCFALSPAAWAVVPPPDGGYPSRNTAEGTAALLSLTSGFANTAIGWRALFSDTTGGNNTATGHGALFSNIYGNDNTAYGFDALFNNNSGPNTAVGSQALFHNTTGFSNTAAGFRALFSNTGGQGDINQGVGNTAVGEEALGSNTTGNNNIALGVFAGFNLTQGANNIDIGNLGVAGEANTIRIGTNFNANNPGLPFQSKTFVAGIYAETTGSATTLPVIVDVNGQLGTTASSRKFKKDIGPMDKASEAILALKPVTFHYKNDSKGVPQFGLIAEEVEKVNPDLITRDREGEPYTVRYDAVNAMLLNEFLKEHRKVEELKNDFQKEIQALTAQVKEQAAQIQKVSAQLEVNKPAPQTVLNQ